MKKEQFKMIEIYRGKDEKWKGWYNLIISDGNPENDMPIAGPIHPILAKRILNAINTGMKTEPEIRDAIKFVNKQCDRASETGDWDGQKWNSGRLHSLEWVLNEQGDKHS